ncbi:hypothetical protein CYMTET_52882 [Cymbomonas tetramitiformis]|uniref:Glycosyltransferase 61 catalytic domain-containing protein n=1 Tax=Cymbomonas tetramitiformis TaxID=36881 RepID=A0AAE0BI38_9CHLO|nr:hypothetical protein CYMTET_52882 [Cymbomonas tetramitiformis]
MPADDFYRSAVPYANLIKGLPKNSTPFFSPVLDGLQIPTYLAEWLEPFTSLPVTDFAELTSRKHTDHCQRCYAQALVCNRPPSFPMMGEIGGDPCTVAKEIVRHFLGPSALQEPRDVPFRQQQIPKLKVLFIDRASAHSRKILNAGKLVEVCNKWQPKDFPALQMECGSIDFAGLPTKSLLESLKDVDILIGTHGAGLINGFFLSEGSSIVEVLPYGFRGGWPDLYFRGPYQKANCTFYFSLEIDAPHYSKPGNNEIRNPLQLLENNTTPVEWATAQMTWARDRNSIVTWRVLDEIFQTILGLDKNKSAYAALENYTFSQSREEENM